MRRGQAPATTETKPNKKVDRYSRRKSKNGNEKSGFARRLSAKPRFFSFARCLKLCFFSGALVLPQNHRFCNSREFTACACLDINERKNGVLLYIPDTTANVPPLIVARVLVLITSRAENIFPINTALLPQALRKISRLYFNSLHKVIVKQIMLYDDRIEIQFNAPIKVSPDSDESRRGFSLCSKTVKLAYKVPHRANITKLEFEIEIYI